MKILIINSGSSSIKYQLFNMPEEEVICTGLIERIGLEKGLFHYVSKEYSIHEEIAIRNHKVGLKKMVNLLLDKEKGVISSTGEVEIVGHRVVHGGNTLTETVIIDEEVKNKITDLISLAPIHNPANLKGIEIAELIFTQATQVAAFDTSFHQNMPVKAHKYAIPNKFLDEHNIRLFGFHGLSVKYVSEKIINHLQKEESKIIVIHLGNGCSITAVKNGQSMDHSQGFGPVAGLIMGTRSGDVDPTLIYYMVKTLGYDFEDVNMMLQKESGMLGLTGFSDLRDVEEQAEKGDKKCQLALDMYAYRVKKYIGSYTATMNGLDAIVFTAGVGQKSNVIRRMICEEMDVFGIELDTNKNLQIADKLIEIHKYTSKVKVFVIPTNEELEIAKQAYKLV